MSIQRGFTRIHSRLNAKEVIKLFTTSWLWRMLEQSFIWSLMEAATKETTKYKTAVQIKGTVNG